MKMIRIIVLAVTVLLVTFAFSSCTGKNSAPVTESGNETTQDSEILHDSESTENEIATEAAVESTTEIKSTVSPEAVKSAYKEFLRKYMKEHGENNGGEEWPKFGLIYLDDDDLPELVIPIGTIHAATCELYSFDGEKVVMVGEYGSWGSFGYYPRKGIIVGGYAGSGGVSTIYYKYRNGEAEEIAEFFQELKHWEDDPSIPENWNYSVGEKQVSQKEYEKAENDLMKEFGLKTGEERSTEFTYELNENSINLID